MVKLFDGDCEAGSLVGVIAGGRQMDRGGFRSDIITAAGARAFSPVVGAALRELPCAKLESMGFSAVSTFTRKTTCTTRVPALRVHLHIWLDHGLRIWWSGSTHRIVCRAHLPTILFGLHASEESLAGCASSTSSFIRLEALAMARVGESMQTAMPRYLAVGHALGCALVLLP